MTPSPTTPQGAEPREDGWVEWTGGENPVGASVVEAHLVTGATIANRGDHIPPVAWSNLVVRYRIASPAPAATTNGGGDIERLRVALNSAVGYLTTCSETFAKRQPQDADARKMRAGLAMEWAHRTKAALQPQPQPTQQGGAEDGYRDAFYELAGILGLTAMPISPREAWETRMKPAILAALKTEKA